MRCCTHREENCDWDAAWCGCYPQTIWLNITPQSLHMKLCYCVLSNKSSSKDISGKTSWESLDVQSGASYFLKYSLYLVWPDLWSLTWQLIIKKKMFNTPWWLCEHNMSWSALFIVPVCIYLKHAPKYYSMFLIKKWFYSVFIPWISEILHSQKYNIHICSLVTR